MKLRLKVISVIGIFLLFISCASHKFDQKAFDEAYSKGDYETCISMLSQRGVYDKESVPLKNMDLATLAHYMKDYKQSQNYFRECDLLMEEGDLRSIAQFESFYLNILNSLNYHHQGNLEGALVEIKQADHEKVNKGKSESNALWFIQSLDEQALLSVRSAEDDAKKGELIKASLNEDEAESDEYKNTMSKFGIPEAEVSEGTPRKPTEKDLYRSSPTAYYLGHLFREAEGDEEGARLDRDILKTLNPNFKVLTKEKDKALLNVLSFAGEIAKKEEVVYYYPREENGQPRYMGDIKVSSEDGKVLTLSGMRYKFAYVKAGENNTRVNRVVTVAKNVETGEEVEVSCEFLEDFGNELKKNVALKARKEFNKNKSKSIIGKSAIAITYMIAVVAAEITAQTAESPIAQAVAQAAVVAALVTYKASLEAFDKGIKADTRQARFLPACSYAGQVSLDEGTYNVKVQYKNDDILIKEEEFNDVKVKSSSLNLLESICLN